MKIDILASGSGGNCISLRSGNNTLLVDVGIAKTKIEKKLLEVGIRPDSIKAILITHAHADHIKGLPLANKYKIPVYAAEGEWRSIKSVDKSLQFSFKSNTHFEIANCSVETFKTHHDAHDPVGYTIHDSFGYRCSVCLDTGHVDENMINIMEYSNCYILEANHEPSMLEVSDYPNSVKARILSHIGHLSNEQTGETLQKLIIGNGEKIYLTHLSSSNNMPALAEMTIKRMLAKKGYKPGKHYELEVIS